MSDLRKFTLLTLIVVSVAWLGQRLSSAQAQKQVPPAAPARVPAANTAAPASPAGTTVIFGNNAPITINDATTASLYPSTITVSGVSPATVTGVSVRLLGFSHTFPDDVDIILVGPQGQRAVIMSDAGGGNPGVSGLNLTFNPTSTNVLPDEGPLVTGTTRPANYDPANADFFPAPFPAPNTLTDAAADLSVFNLTNPNGDWKLYVVDDAGQDVGSISGGWLLTLTVPTVFTVNSTADPGNGVCDAAECTLREALNAALANTGNGDLVNFSALFNTPQTINLLTVLPDISESLTIQGPGANLLTVRRADTAPDFRIFNILSGIPNVSLSGLTISNGRATTGGVGSTGGGILSQSNLTLTGVHVTGNQALNNGGGGGVELNSADGVFTGCTFSNNTATFGGGIIYNGNGGGTLRLINSTVSGNIGSSNSGSGIINFSFSGNSRLEVTNSTIAGNTNGSGILTSTQNAGSTATTTLRNTIIAGNTPNNLATQMDFGGGAATFQTLGFNLSDNFNNQITPAVNDITTATPRLGPLALNGGTTPTHTLLGGSPALDVGNASGSATDQRGVARPATLADIGAVEMQSILVSNTNDSGANSLRAAINTANTNGAGLDDIIFDNNVFNTPQTITLTSGELAINSSLTINGPGANLPTISGNNASRVFNINSGFTVSLNGMTITGGNDGEGGSIRNNGTLTVTNTTIAGNTATGIGGIGGFGGGIFNGGTLTVTNSTVSGNTAALGGGGGISNGGGTLTVSNSTISGNTANGGGSDRGGGIENQGNLTVTNSTISGNRVPNGDNNGGGIYNNNANATITNCTITNNSVGGAFSVGGVFRQAGTVTIRNSLIAANVNNATQPDVSGAFAAASAFNLIGNVGTATGFTPANQNQTGNGTTQINPLLGPLTNNGGTTPTHALLPGSPALDKGGAGVTTDQRGLTRPVNITSIPMASGGNESDIGAFEFQGQLLTVTKTADTNDGVCDADCSLREALAAAAAGDGIAFAALFNTSQTITLGGTELAIGKNLTINGPGANLLTISGNNTSRVFNIGSGFTVRLSGMTITGGNADSGGGIRNDGTLTVTNSTISGNMTSDFGGGIRNNGTLTVTNSTVSGNTAELSGGGIFNSGSSTLTVTNSTISGNTANGLFGRGGGIENLGNLTVTNSTISSNRVPNGDNNGGGIRSDLGNATITNSTITNNSAAGAASASGVFRVSGAVTIRSSLIAANANNAAQPDVVANGGTGITSTGFNLIGNRGALTFSGTGDQSGTGTNPLNPRLGPLQNNGGPTLTHALLGGSLALDAGNNTGSGQITDQRGLAFNRTVDLPGTVPGSDNTDIGAFEAQTIPAAAPPLVVSIVRASSNPANAGTSAGYTVTFSANVNPAGVGASDFTLTTTGGLTGAAITGVSGSGAVYNVTVNTGTGSGTLRLDVTDDDTIVDGSGVPLGGLGAGNGNFTTGEAYTVNAPPTANANAANVTTSGAISYTFTVTYTDDLGLNVATLDSSDVRVTSPVGSFNAAAAFVSVNINTNGSPRTATYSIAPPGGSWDFADNGTYSVVMQASQVADTNGSFVAAGTLTTFTVSVCPAITVNPASLPLGIAGVPYSQIFTQSGSAGAISWSVSAGALPAGLTLNGSTGLFAGLSAVKGVFNFTIRATDINNCSGTRAYTLTFRPKAKADFDNDGKTDLSIFSPTAAPPLTNWSVINSGNGATATQQWGAGYAPYFDDIVPGDYDGDGKADHAIWRGADSIWYIRRSSDGQPFVQLWGANYAPYFDIPTPGDYDGDGKTDIGVFRRSGTWFVRRSSDGQNMIVTHGQQDDIPVPADYDGDGKTDLAVFRPGAIAPAPNWIILNSSTNTITSIQWGAGYAPYFDTPVPADYDGDGKADLAIWRGADSIWYIRPSATPGSPILQFWGANYAPYFDIPTPGDYDGDGKADIAVWRRSGTWFVKRSTDGSFLIQNQGQSGDVPVPAFGVR
ncbi:MAG: VCBS repeat-containing protein [Acidobacteria bacterium]|nr:VCBS repeat-containing protein [Acidobacteriota bacterium]